MKLSKEDRYIRRRLRQGRKQAREFYYCRKYPINPKKIVFTTIEGTTGFSCNPKYIALELLRRRQDLDLVWLVDDMSKEFPAGIRKVKNTLKNRAYELSTSAVWVDNSRKQLECRKRPGQFYLQTWHASIAIKPIGLERGASFSKIARMVTEHDSRMIDLFVTNSAWVEEHAALGMLYHGKMIRTGSARVDALINDRDNIRLKFRERYGLTKDTKIAMYAPTFRSGSQGTERDPAMQNKMPDFGMLRETLEKRFSGKWVIVLRLHPQLTARHISLGLTDETETVIDASREDDMCETLGAADFLLTDYSALTFDAAFIDLPVFLYVYDLKGYIKDRGQLSWNLQDLPFPHAETMDELCRKISGFEVNGYKEALQKMWKITELNEDGHATNKIVDIIEKNLIISDGLSS